MPNQPQRCGTQTSLRQSDTFEPNSSTHILEDQSLSLGFFQLPTMTLRASNLSRDPKTLYAVLLVGRAWQKLRGLRQRLLAFVAKRSVL